MNLLSILLQSSAINDATQTAYRPVEDLVTSTMNAIGEWAPKILGAVVALLVGLWIVRLLTGLFRKMLDKSNMDDTLKPFLTAVVSFGLKTVLFLGIAQMLGFGVTSFAAILVGVGAAIGGAFNGSLGNIASGVMLLIFRPFSVGDLVQLPDGTFGFIKEISVFVTTIVTFQNKTEIVPNSTITAGKITNLTTIGNLRIDMPFGIRYGADVAKAKQIVMDVLTSDPHVLKNPAPRVAVNNLGENAVELLALPYVGVGEYWEVYWDTREKILEALGKAGFDAPLPQRVVTMINK